MTLENKKQQVKKSTTKLSANKLHVGPDEELKILRNVMQITNSALDLQVILDEVVKLVTEMTKADSVFVYLFDDKGSRLRLMASKTPHQKELGNLIIKLGEGIAGWVARENKQVAISNNAFKDKRFKSFDVLPEDKYEAILSAPIYSKEKVIGVINVQHRQPHEYARNTIDLISLIARQIGGSIEHARVYEQARQKALQFDAINKVSQSITSENYLDEILNLIVVVTANMMNSKICSILLLDKKGNDLVMKATQSLSVEYVKKPSLKANEGIIGDVFMAKKPVSVDDVRHDQRYRFKEMAEREGLTSMLAVPMIVKDQAIGVVTVYTKDVHIFTDEEIGILQIIANQAAVAVENTKLVDEAVKSREALETRKVVERAKGILMQRRNLDESAAYRLIHRKAMDSCRSMKDIAESVILMEELG
jgi:signal transduction protein with GAF and PtsI domain